MSGMSRIGRWSTRCAVLAGFAMLAAAPRTAAQVQSGSTTGSISGTVRDSAGMPIAGAQVSVGAARAVTSGQGSFRLEAVPVGAAPLEVRRLGYRMRMLEVAVALGQTASVAVVLSRVPQELAPVVVEATRGMQMRQLADFYNRRAKGVGRFITRDQIEARNSTNFTDVLRSLVPGLTVVSTRLASQSVRFRGNQCAPLVVLDGFPATAGEFDLVGIDPMTVMGVEVYSGIATVPMEFRTNRGVEACGVVAIWSGMPPRPPRARMTEAQVRQVLDSLSSPGAPRVYEANEVDQPARVDSAELVNPAFPDSLYARAVEGEVVASFIIDTTGLVIPGSIDARSSTHPLFLDAVRRALLASRFHRAVHNGRPVRQVMVLPFRFVLQNERRE